nr:6027_t:CDS:2 [Entrophospora candida]
MKMFCQLTEKLQKQFQLPKLPKKPPEENSLPFIIGSNVSIKNYNKFLESYESSGYKFEYKNGDVFIVEMCTAEHEFVITLLLDYFKIPNGGVIINPPIRVCGQPYHPSPNADGLIIAPDVAVYPSRTYIPRPNSGPTYLGPPPSDTRGNPHARIICEVAISQSVRGWKDKCTLWMLQQYAKLWRRGMQTQTWSFGTVEKGNNIPTECNAPGNPAYQINIPISDTFWDPPIPTIGYVPLVARPAIIGGNFIIDLYEIQQVVLEYQNE